MRLIRFSYKMQYVPGKSIAAADTLPRAPLDYNCVSLLRVHEVQWFIEGSFSGLQNSSFVAIKKAHAQDGVFETSLQLCRNE